jgi:uncharacterized DUF497 family protein
MSLVFEWDEAKARTNEIKHGVTFDEARTVFNDPFSISIPDPEHSEEEERWLDLGLSNQGRLLVVWYTESDENIRIIGSRLATRTEAESYAHERSRQQRR